MAIALERNAVSEDTMAILLLCATLGKADDQFAPLSAAEYGFLAEALHAARLRPRFLMRATGPELDEVVERIAPRGRGKLGVERLRYLLDRGGQLAARLSVWSAQGLWVRSRADDEYPTRFKRVLGRSAPPLVYGIGPLVLTERGGIAVVGSRKPDPASADYARHVGQWAAKHDVSVVSGAAAGIDEIAMTEAAEAGGSAVGVVAESLLRLATHRAYRRHIIDERVTLVGTFDPGAGFSVGRAMGRNRLVYALADRALVVACSEDKGGTWTGALEAMGHGVAVYVNVGNPARPGNSALVLRGARPAPADLKEMFAVEPPPSAHVAPDVAPDAVYRAVAPLIVGALQTSRSAKELAGELDVTAKQLAAWLAKLTADGSVVKAGSRYRAVAFGGESGASGPAQMKLLG